MTPILIAFAAAGLVWGLVYALRGSLLAGCLLLHGLSLVMVTSASSEVAAAQSGNPLYFMYRHLIYLAIGFVSCGVVMLIPMATWQRFGFALLAKEGYASQGTARVAVAPEGTEPTDFVDTVLHEAGLPARRGIYVTEFVFDREGIWNGVVQREGEELPFAFQVKAEPDAPTIGAAAPKDASPTPAAPWA